MSNRGGDWSIATWVTKGRGIAASLRSKEIECLGNCLGKCFVPGSLNLLAREPVWLDTRMAIFSARGHYFWPGRIADHEVVISRWMGNCPAHVFEIYSTSHLRTVLRLADQDSVRLDIPSSCIDHGVTGSIAYRFSWYMAWYRRERFFYQDTRGLQWLFHWRVQRALYRAYQGRTT